METVHREFQFNIVGEQRVQNSSWNFLHQCRSMSMHQHPITRPNIAPLTNASRFLQPERSTRTENFNVWETTHPNPETARNWYTYLPILIFKHRSPRKPRIRVHQYINESPQQPYWFHQSQHNYSAIHRQQASCDSRATIHLLGAPETDIPAGTKAMIIHGKFLIPKQTDHMHSAVIHQYQSATLN